MLNKTTTEMETYKLTTGNGINQMNLHSNNLDEMVFDNLDDAIEAYIKEDLVLNQSYNIDVHYFNEDNESNLVYCRIQLYVNGELSDSELANQIEEEYTSQMYSLN